MECKRRTWRGRGAGYGFSLVEMLVVISIVGVLIAILLPTLGKSRDAARTALCMSNLRQQGVGLAAYSTDFKNEIPQFPGAEVTPGMQPTWSWRRTMDDGSTGKLLEISSEREWFLYYRGYVAHAIPATVFDDRLIARLGAMIKVFDCPSTSGPTYYTGTSKAQRTFDYRRIAHYTDYNTTYPSRAQASKALEILRTDKIPTNGMILVDGLAKANGTGNATALDYATGADYPSLAAYPTGLNTAWYYVNLTTDNQAAAYAAVGGSWGHTYIKDGTTGSDTGPAASAVGVHHAGGANVLFHSGAVRTHKIATIVPGFDNPASVSDLIILAPKRVID